MGGPHSCTLYLLIILTLEEEVGMGKAELQQGEICGMDMEVLCGRVSCCNLCLTIWMDGCTGTEVKRALTSYESDGFPCFQTFALELLK